MEQIKKKKIFVTSALPFCNNPPHLGNLIGSTLSADVMVRYLKKKGHDVMFVCGSDDYGTTTEVKALKEKITCEEVCDKYRPTHEDVYKWFNIDFSVFGKTSTETHTILTQEIFNLLNQKNLLTEKTSEQYYCETCDRFVCDRFIHGVCYLDKCGGLVKGDECDKCCKMIDIDKIQKKWCSVCNQPPVKRETTHLYFELEPYKQQLIDYFLQEETKTSTDSILPNYDKRVKYLSQPGKRLTKEWLNKDLLDRCVTRDLRWGAPLPTFDNFPNLNGKVSWPWFDAPIGYISILAHANPDTWREWMSPDVDWYQFMAKDNVPFHTVVFPATLIGSEFQDLYCGVTHLSATEYLLFDNKKFSKSDGVGIFGDQVIKISQQFEIDEDYWRYYLIKIRPENADSTFDFKGFCDVIKGELAQKIGNLLNRLLFMTKTYYGCDENNNTILSYDFSNFAEKMNKLKEIVRDYQLSFDNFHYHEIIILINKIAELGNEWINEHEVYNICKDGNKAMEHFLGNAVFIMWLFAELAEPIMPKKSKTIKNHMSPIDVSSDIIVTFDEIDQTLLNNTGKMIVNHENTQKLFKQIKFEDIVKKPI